MEIKVREATLADAAVVRDVHLASIEGLGPSAYDERVVVAWAHDRDPDDYPIECEKTHFVVAERGGDDHDGGEERRNIVGFGWLGFEPGEHFVSKPDAEVVAVYVHPVAVREGIGSTILTGLERVARERGVETLGLWASLSALAFYREQGYERVVEHVHEFAPGVEGRVVEMRTRL